MKSIHASLAQHRFIRTTDERILGGVCSGLARRFGVDPWAIRALLVLSLLLVPGSQIIIYPVLWLVMPDEARAAELATPALSPGAPLSAPVVAPDVAATSMTKQDDSASTAPRAS